MIGAGQRLEARSDGRQVQRDAVEFDAMLRAADGTTIDVRVVNLSARGFMARTEASFAIDAPIRITLPRVGALDARIAWTLGGRIGAQFILPLAPDRYDDLLSACRRPR